MTRPVLHNVDEIAIVEHRARHGYNVAIGQAWNGDSFVEITGLKREGEAWSPTGFGFRLPWDAIPPDMLRALVEAAIEDHLPPEEFAVLKAAEASEREIISRLVGGLGGGR